MNIHPARPERLSFIHRLCRSNRNTGDITEFFYFLPNPENRRMNAATSFRCTTALSPILSRVHLSLRRALRVYSWSVVSQTEKVCSSGPIWRGRVPFRPRVRMGHVAANRLGTP